jgi:6-phosphogluconate dehydrogenase
VTLQHRTFLIEIAIDICRQPDPSGEAAHLLNRVQDKVVQDADDSLVEAMSRPASSHAAYREGTGTWAVMEASKRHVSAPTFTAAHFFRLASADRAQRLKVADLLGADIGGAKKQQLSDADKAAFLEDMRLATYCAFLASFAQGLNLIARASKDEGWKVRLADCIRIWREGCIIRAEHIADLLQPALEQAPDCTNVLTLEPLAREIRKAFPALKRVVQHGVEWDAHMCAPRSSSSLAR